MWVSKKAWREMQDSIAGLRLDAHGRDTDLSRLTQRVADLEKQVLPKNTYWVFSLNGPVEVAPSAGPVTLLQKVNLLLDHLKLRVQPEGTTPVALVKKTGAK